MRKVFVVFEKSDHPIGKLGEPVKVFMNDQKAKKYANAQALKTGQPYTVGSYESFDEGDIHFPEKVFIKGDFRLGKENKWWLACILEIREATEADEKIQSFVRIDRTSASCDICAVINVEQTENSYFDTIDKFKELALQELSIKS